MQERTNTQQASRYVPRHARNQQNNNNNNNNNNQPQQNGNRRNDRPSSSLIQSMEDFETAWRRELRTNPNASAEGFVQDKRVQLFFSKQENGGIDAHFLKTSANAIRQSLEHHRRECEKTARQFKAQGYYPWAEQWERYGKNPDGPYPECTHEQLKAMFMWKNGKGEMGFDDVAYQKMLNRGSDRGCSSVGVDVGVGAPKTTYAAKKDEMTNAQLGEILSGHCEHMRKGRSCHCGGKGHPEQLIAKLRRLQEKYPEIYKKSPNLVM